MTPSELTAVAEFVADLKTLCTTHQMGLVQSGDQTWITATGAGTLATISLPELNVPY